MAQADAHACLLDALNLRKVVVIGGSMGATSRSRPRTPICWRCETYVEVADWNTPGGPLFQPCQQHWIDQVNHREIGASRPRPSSSIYATSTSPGS